MNLKFNFFASLMKLQASPTMLNMWPCKNISHSSLVMCPFATPAIKLKLRQQIGGGLLLANHLNQSLWWINQKNSLSTNYIIFITFFLHVHNNVVPFTSHGNMHNYANQPKPFSWTKPTYVGFVSSNFIVQDHIPNTIGYVIRVFCGQYNTLII
jgi:hypothetical protein